MREHERTSEIVALAILAALIVMATTAVVAYSIHRDHASMKRHAPEGLR